MKDDISCSALPGCPGMNFPIFTNYVTIQRLIRGTRVTCHTDTRDLRVLSFVERRNNLPSVKVMLH